MNFMIVVFVLDESIVYEGFFVGYVIFNVFISKFWYNFIGWYYLLCIFIGCFNILFNFIGCCFCVILLVVVLVVGVGLGGLGEFIIWFRKEMLFVCNLVFNGLFVCVL